MTNTELALNMLAEAATTELLKEKDPQYLGTRTNCPARRKSCRSGPEAIGKRLGAFGDFST